VLIVSEDTSLLASTFGMTPGLSVAAPARLNAPGTVMRAKLVDGASPNRLRLRRERVDLLGAGAGDGVSSSWAAGEAGAAPTPAQPADRRGTADDLDTAGQARRDAAEEPKVEAWQAAPVTTSSCATRST